jgi:hypothetical protein
LGLARTVSVPFESRVRRILVTEGQMVSAEIHCWKSSRAATPASKSNRLQNDYQAAKKAAEYMRQRFELKLATSDQLLQGTQALDQAQAEVEKPAMRRRCQNR